MEDSTWTTRTLLVAGLMLLTGSINTLSTKWADKLASPGYNNVLHPFTHPFIQALGMFIGEFLCLIVFKLNRWFSKRSQSSDDPNSPTSFSILIFLPAALCDLTATSLMYFALTLTFASSFQMLRGAVIAFTGLLSAAFLNQFLSLKRWISILIVLLGLMIVGVSDFLFESSFVRDPNAVLAGDLLIIIAQIIVAMQMVYEQNILSKYSIHPLQVVGLEGFWGFCSLFCVISIFNFVHAPAFAAPNPRHLLSDISDAFLQMKNNPVLCIAIAGNILSISFFNFSGIYMTKVMNATTRMVLDTLRTLVIWITCLSLKWQSFHYLQLIGFVTLILGMCVYENLTPNLSKYFPNRISTDANTIDEERNPLL